MKDDSLVNTKESTAPRKESKKYMIKGMKFLIV
jgi:hypothetical protein